MIAQTGEYLGLALANLVSILNPEMIVVGGGVAAAGNLLLAPARDTMRQWAQPLAGKQVRIVRSRLGGRAALLGMAKMAFDLTAR
jgi:glucokinase